MKKYVELKSLNNFLSPFTAAILYGGLIVGYMFGDNDWPNLVLIVAGLLIMAIIDRITDLVLEGKCQTKEDISSQP